MSLVENLTVQQVFVPAVLSESFFAIVENQTHIFSHKCAENTLPLKKARETEEVQTKEGL